MSAFAKPSFFSTRVEKQQIFEGYFKVLSSRFPRSANEGKIDGGKYSYTEFCDSSSVFLACTPHRRAVQKIIRIFDEQKDFPFYRPVVEEET